MILPALHILALSLLPPITNAYISHGLPTQYPLKPHSHSNAPEINSFNWFALTPSQNLSYTPCYNSFQCARLTVPLNWNGNPSTNRTFSIAIVKLPARVPITDPRYGGPVLINPGGPGESGVERVVKKGRNLQIILDSDRPPSQESGDGSKYFDVIGFDPRGVWHTTPRLRCFPDARGQHEWLVAKQEYGVVWESEQAVGLEWARMESLLQSCAAGEEGVLRFVNTAQTARDMLEIVERHAEWREREAGVEWEKGQEKLLYWGISYGTILGQTFASMFPDRVHRLVIDGVVDPDDYYKGEFLRALTDSDKAMTKLTEYCFEAGPGKCPIFRGDSAKDIEAWIEDLVWRLKTDPMSVSATGSGSIGPEVVTFGDLQLRGMGATAFPFEWAEHFFALLSEVAKGNVSGIIGSKQARLRPKKPSKACLDEGPYSNACMSDDFIGLLGATQSITCMDSIANREPPTKAGFNTYFQALTRQSRWFSSGWAQYFLVCLGHDENMHPAWQFDGDIGGKTSHPLLIIGNTHDTATPLANARKVSTLFPGSSVLHQLSEGHSSGASPSVCTGKVLREYFQSGKLPEADAVCEPEYLPFLGCTRKDKHGHCLPRSGGDERLWQAVKDMLF